MSYFTTKRQFEIVKFIRDYFKEHNFPPTFREIGSHFGFKSTNSISCHFNALERKGLIKRNEYGSRTLQLTDKALAYFDINNRDELLRVSIYMLKEIQKNHSTPSNIDSDLVKSIESVIQVIEEASS